jgi:hypothetical protein
VPAGSVGTLPAHSQATDASNGQHSAVETCRFPYATLLLRAGTAAGCLCLQTHNPVVSKCIRASGATIAAMANTLGGIIIGIDEARVPSHFSLALPTSHTR